MNSREGSRLDTARRRALNPETDISTLARLAFNVEPTTGKCETTSGPNAWAPR